MVKTYWLREIICQSRVIREENSIQTYIHKKWEKKGKTFTENEEISGGQAHTNTWKCN